MFSTEEIIFERVFHGGKTIVENVFMEIHDYLQEELFLLFPQGNYIVSTEED
jgi:hypothetical protein